MTTSMTAAILAGLLLTGWRCEITDPSKLPPIPAEITALPGMQTWVAREAGCSRKWRRYG